MQRLPAPPRAAAASSSAPPRHAASRPDWTYDRTGTDTCTVYNGLMLRLEDWSRPAGESPVRVSAGAPGSRPRFVVERRRAERGVESLFGGSKRAGWDCSLVTFTTGEPSRSCHGEGHARQSWLRIGCGGSSRGIGTCTRARSVIGTREARLSSFVSKDRSYKPMVKSSGGQRESDGVVVVMIDAKVKASGAKGPGFDRGCVGGKR
jgi:hypothetical protein